MKDNTQKENKNKPQKSQNAKKSKRSKRYLLKDPYSKVFIYHANTIACSLGELTASEEHIFDFLSSQIKRTDPVGKRYSIYISDIIHYYGSSAGKNYRKVRTGLDNLSKAHFNVYNDNTNSVSFIPIFQYIKYEDHENKAELINQKKIYYQFNSKASPYLFQLQRNYCKMQLSTPRAIKSKGALTLLRLWAAKKDYSSEVRIEASMNSWRIALQGKKEGVKPLSNKSIVQTIKRAVKTLNKAFNHRYYLEYCDSRGEHKADTCAVEVFGDNSTPFPILNNENDFGDGGDILFYNESGTSTELEDDIKKVKKIWGIDRNDPKYPHAEINKKVEDPFSGDIDKFSTEASAQIFNDNDLPF